MEAFATILNKPFDSCLVFVEEVAPKKSRLEYKICCSTPMCIVLCHARIIYVHSTSLGMSRSYIHLDVHGHHILQDI